MQSYDEFVQYIHRINSELSHLSDKDREAKIKKDLKISSTDLREFSGIKDLLDFKNPNHQSL